MDAALMKLVRQAADILKAGGAREVYLFGSAAAGKLRRNSDIDMAVSGLPPRIFFRMMGKAETVLGRPLDLIDLDSPSLFNDYLKKKGKLVRVA